MKTSSKSFLVAALSVLLWIGSACSGTDRAKEAIYDDAEQIAAEGDQYTFTSRTGDGETDTELELQYKGFSGTETIWSLKAAADSRVSFVYSSTVAQGDFKAVLITPQQGVETLLEGSGDGETTLDIAAGEYRVKIVGRKAEGSLSMSVAGDTNLTMVKNEE